MLRALVLLVAVIGCASGTRTAPECSPLPADYQSYNGLYQACNVDQRARVVTTPRPDFSQLQPLVTASAGCYTAEFTMVVDEKGLPIERSIALVRTNSQSYAQAIRNQISGLRFDPAKKDGMPVRQFYNHESKMRYAVSRSGTSPTRRPPPC